MKGWNPEVPGDLVKSAGIGRQHGQEGPIILGLIPGGCRVEENLETLKP